MAIRALSALRHDLGLAVPGDISVIGFDDTPIAAMPEFALATLGQPAERMIDSVIRLLMNKIADPDCVAENVALALELMICGAVRVDRSVA